jgi:transposase
MQVLKQVLGVDVAQKELVVTLGKISEDHTVDLYFRRAFANKESGFGALLKWLGKHRIDGVPLRVVMEATGVYHQRFAYFLKDNSLDLTIVLPNKISNYMRTLETKTVTDQSCADAIARFGLERKLNTWQAPDPAYEFFQELTRERDQLVSERVVIKNRLHAQKAKAWPSQEAILRLEARKHLLNQQEKEIKKQLSGYLKKQPQIKQQVELLCSIPGIGELTAVTILGETNGFELIRNKKQLTSYAGLDVREKQSGTSIKGKPRISKKGNRNLRKAMHLPALTAIRHDERYKDLFARLVSRHGIKMKAVVAVQRKLLELTFILFKNQTSYEPHILKNKEERQLQ